MRYLDIYRVIEGTDNWPLIETIEAETDQECIEIAEERYDYNDNTIHYVNPY